jgi:hypothetical protein
MDHAIHCGSVTDVKERGVDEIFIKYPKRTFGLLAMNNFNHHGRILIHSVPTHWWLFGSLKAQLCFCLSNSVHAIPSA